MDLEKLNKAIALRHYLHENPELSGEEIITKKFLMDFIKENTSLKVFDRGKWFYALHYEGDEFETIAFRADFDAITDSEGCPFHGCGHDGHSATLAGFAMSLEGQKLNKNVVLLFQFGEENGSGAIECREIFKEIKIDRIYGQHNIPGMKEKTIFLKKGTMMFASKGMSIKLTGKQSHASQPENGINPVYLIGEIIKSVEPLMNVSGFNEYKLANLSDVTLATIVNVQLGEKAFGVSPAYGEINLTIRSALKEDLKILEDSLEKFVKDYCESYGIEYEIEFFDVFPVTSNDSVLVDRFVELLKKTDYKVEILNDAMRGSEDFGWYGEFSPSLFFFIGAGENYPSIHTENYEFPDELIEVGVDVFNLIVRE